MIAIEQHAAPPIRELHADSIEWELRPKPAPAPMTRDELIIEATVDGLSYRLALLEAIDLLARRQHDNDRLRASLRQLRQACFGTHDDGENEPWA